MHHTGRRRQIGLSTTGSAPWFADRPKVSPKTPKRTNDGRAVTERRPPFFTFPDVPHLFRENKSNTWRLTR
ncbi:hypothetical protein SPHINGOT1_70042 [Sphingomonas sp. T1]|nr:hypothetical protein SPHINGOT1_70042 [Sphingomonas sp. T1]